MASSTAAYGAKAGLRTVILLKQDSAPEKTLSTGIHGASVFKVRGDYGALFKESYRIGREHGVLFLNSVDPLRIEGYKITGFEIYQQLQYRAPRFVFVPVSSAGHLIGLMRSFLDLRREGLVDQLPVFVGVQARGCSPLAEAFDRGQDRFRRVRHPETIAHAISNPDPPGGNLALKLIRENQGILMAVTDLEILAAQKELAELEGIFADPASATALAGLAKFSRSRRLNSRDTIVLVITGSGLKAMDSLGRQDIRVHRVSLGRLDKALSEEAGPL
jgi:threonine synthase